MRRTVVASLVCCCALGIAAAHAQAPPRTGALVLGLTDLGPGYRINPGLTGARTLTVISQGDPAAIRRELSRTWLRGTVHAFNGAAIKGVKVQWGVISIADVFRKSARMKMILDAWERDLVRISKGHREPTPVGAPGAGGALVRGHLLTYELLIYMWRRGNTIASVDVTGPPGSVPLSMLMRLVHRQDSKVLAGSLERNGARR
jgi:hypothetical protein